MINLNLDLVGNSLGQSLGSYISMKNWVLSTHCPVMGAR